MKNLVRVCAMNVLDPRRPPMLGNHKVKLIRHEVVCTELLKEPLVLLQFVFGTTGKRIFGSELVSQKGIMRGMIGNPFE